MKNVFSSRRSLPDQWTRSSRANIVLQTKREYFRSFLNPSFRPFKNTKAAFLIWFRIFYICVAENCYIRESSPFPQPTRELVVKRDKAFRFDLFTIIHLSPTFYGWYREVVVRNGSLRYPETIAAVTTAFPVRKRNKSSICGAKRLMGLRSLIAIVQTTIEC